jgi:hypothetical protein
MPATLRRRFNSLDRYVSEIAYEQLRKRGVDQKDRVKFLGEHLREIQASVLIISVTRFLEDGIAAAENAIEIAESLDLRGFTIGRAEFSRDSKDVAEWKVVHQSLSALVEKFGLAKYASQAHVWGAVDAILEDLS